MPFQPAHSLTNLRALLESSATIFAAAGYEQRAVLFRQGDACDSVMYIEQGAVRLAVTSPGGREAICGLLSAGAFLSEEVLGGHTLQRHTATAVTATEVLIVAKADMVGLLHTHDAIRNRFVEHILARHAHLEDDLTDQLLHSSEQRLARALLMLAGCGQESPSRRALPRVSQEVIAEMVGTTRARVNAFMGKFKKLGFLEQDGGVIHVNPSLLHVIDSHRTGPPRPHEEPGAREADDAARVTVIAGAHGKR